LRFPGFEGEWEEKKLGEVITNKCLKYDPRKSVEQIKCIELEHISPKSGHLLGYIDGSLSSSIKNTFVAGDVLFGKLRPYLRKYLHAPFEGVCSSEIWVLKGKFVSNSFLYFLVQTNKFINLANQSSGSKMPRADWNIVANSKFVLPKLDEQEKISGLFFSLDKRIQTQNKIIEELKSQIKELSIKLFSQKLRFKNYKGNSFPEWSNLKGNEIFDNISNKHHDSDLPILAITQEHGAIPRNLIDYQISVTNKSIESYKKVEKGDFIISLRSFQGGIEYSNYTGICSPAYIILRARIEIDRDFYRYYLRTKKYIKLLNKKLEGIRDGKMISYKYFSDITLPYPSVEEQIKISSFLFLLEKKLEQEKKLLRVLQKSKNVLLKIRVYMNKLIRRYFF
jgi:type I restriction enzyme S subunit